MNRALAALGALALACGEARPLPECVADADCGAGGLCAQGECMFPGAGPTFGLEVRPPPGSPLPRVQLEVQPDGAPLELALPNPARVEPVVLDETGSSSPPDQIRSRIDFFSMDPTGLPGRSRMARVEFIPEESRGATEPAVVSLAPDLLYTIRVVPELVQVGGAEAEPFPEHWVGPLRIRDPNPDEVERLALGIRPYRRLSGRVVNALDTQDRPDGARVQARGMDTGALSTLDRTQAGDFTLRLPNTPDTAFEVWVFPPNSPQPGWRHRSVLAAPDGDLDNLVLELEPTRPDLITAATLQVFGLGAPPEEPNGPGPRVLQGARVTLTSTPASPGTPTTRTYSISGLTDDDGFLRVGGSDRVLPLLAANYVARVDPPPGAWVRPATALQTIRSLTSTPSEQLVLEDFRPQVRVRVESPARVPLPDLRVLAVPLDGGRSAEGRTDPEGFVHLAVDPGDYALVARPRRGPLPTGVALARVQDQNRQTLPPFVLPERTAVVGRLAGPDDAPVANAEVEAFAVFGDRSISLTTARTAADGSFTLDVPRVLPAPLPQ